MDRAIDIEQERVWEQLLQAARQTGLDTAVFTDAHRQVVAQLVAYLQRPFAPVAIPPIILCGRPGTGKTTFLYVLDGLLRTVYGLPDQIEPLMSRGYGRGRRTHAVPKRFHAGQPISLLSVRQWSQLLHFYHWDNQKHRFDAAELTRFVATTLHPMRVLFADEVEMVGYAPLLPDLAQRGLLVVGTSNEYAFRQLEGGAISPRIHRIEGADLRVGDPEDALVTSAVPQLWQLFELDESKAITHNVETFAYYERTLPTGNPIVQAKFRVAIETPWLEGEWVRFCQRFAQPPLFLFDGFSLEQLRTNYNGIIRWVQFFDAVEQIGAGVLVRAAGDAPLSREAISHMKVTIQTARGIDEGIRRRTTAGIDRCVSRLGQAGQRARGWLAVGVG